ncbi:excinuclease ABC subunit UvrB [Candidatus Azambacteria bacterium]|nr:excinuclease ABC subunit UvrB [Candidatus Azambacteria bacterium]
MLKVISRYKPTGDQPKAIEKLTAGIEVGEKDQTLLGVTGSGKTFTMANVIANTKKPTLVISHNKTLAHQLYQEFKEFMPEASVHYFVSYYDYYQPEAYIPQTDTYIDKDVKINEELDRLRHEATQAVLTRNDTIVIASVSCIYNIGSPANYENLSLSLTVGQSVKRSELLKNLVSLQYKRNEIEKTPGTFRAKGEMVEIYPSTGNDILKIEIARDKIESISIQESKMDARPNSVESIKIFPAKFWVAPSDNLEIAIANVYAELAKRLKELKDQGKLLEAQRLEQRTRFDMEMLRDAGYCHGIENYSSHMEFREPDSPPFTLIDYFRHAHGDDFLVMIDESHMTIPQIRGMYAGDKARKETLIEYGFRLPSAKDNRPLRFSEFEKITAQTVYVSATPAEYEIEKSKGNIVEQIIRPTGLLDPEIEVRRSKGQIDDLINEIKKRVEKNERTLITVLTKRMAEDLSEYLKEKGIKVHYLHSETKTLERPEVLSDLRKGIYDAVVGVNLLREGLDLPEVSLIAIIDADKEGFLRNATTLIQTIGRVARNINGKVIMYADTTTKSMKTAIKETERRREIQEKYNKKHGITPKQIEKEIRENILGGTKKGELKKISTSDVVKNTPLGLLSKTVNVKKMVSDFKKEMKKAAEEMDFEKAAAIRDKIKEIKKFM